MRTVVPIFILILMTAYGPLSMLDEFEENQTNLAGESGVDVHDVPTWRIGDTWVYETKFDVAGLIQAANVSASINTLTGDTSMEVTDIKFVTIQGIQTLVYELSIDGTFTSGNNGATLEGTSGRLDIVYEGTDLLRASDLAVWDSEFTLLVEFAPFNLGWIAQELADITFATVYEPPREKFDFPLRTGDQWTSNYQSGTNVTGTSDYFDPTTFDTPYVEDNTTYQVTSDGTPAETGVTPPSYSGCSDSHKVNAWNNTGSANGFEWYCDSVRSYAWYRIINPAGFQIDWLLKTYSPVDSSGGVPQSSPGIRNAVITVEPEFVAILPNATEEVVGHFTVNSANEVGKNLQLRYESDNVIMSLTTDSNGEVTPDLDVGFLQDASAASDDWTSNGVIIWDPVNKIVGAATIVMDLSVVGVDLVAKPDSMIVTRARGNDSVILSQASGYNALPGDTIHFSVPAQNRGVLVSPSTEMEITTPDGSTVRGTLPALAPYSEARVDVNWTVPLDAAIGIQTLSFMVDPDNMVTADENRSNNNASLDIFIGRMPVVNMTLGDNVFTFVNVTIDASSSYDLDSGPVECFFEIQDGFRTEYVDAPNCQTNWSWTDDGEWDVKVIVVDDELDEIELILQAVILNRDPYVNLTSPLATVAAGSSITFNATDSGDTDTISPEGQHVTITWPNSACSEGLYGPYCTLSPEVEGEHQIEVVVTDDDNSSTSDFFTYEVLNVAPTVGEMLLSINGIPFIPQDGIWSVDEDVVVSLAIDGDDTLSDKEGLLITWYPDDFDQNWTVTTSGPNSAITAAWSDSGLHTIRAFATDDDGATSDTILGYVSVNNIAPVLGTLPASQALFEDEVLNLSAIATDVADAEDLIFCWDLIVSVDSDEDGILTNDCDVEGQDLEYSWATSGLRTITANVWDDDNATDTFSIDVTIVNRPPTAVIFVPDDGFSITEGDTITFTGSDSLDTPTDRINLIFIWNDPNTEGAAQDGYGENYTIKFDQPGKFFVNLTVTDDDGKSATASILVEVVEKPSEGLLGVSVTTAIVSALAIFIAVLLGVLVMRGRSSDSEPMITKNIPDQVWNDSPSTSPPPMETASSGPPLPASGLPQGWTMEQWAYYGEQYLADHASAPVYSELEPVQAYSEPVPTQTYSEPVPVYSQPEPVQTYSEPAPAVLDQPMVQEPAPTPASQALADLLDDLDL